MALIDLKVKCIKCGYGIPLTSGEHKPGKDVKCPKCSTVFAIAQDEDEIDEVLE